MTGVHRSRLFAKYLPYFGWEPIVLTIDECCYEEKLDKNLNILIPKAQKIKRVKAFSLSKPRIIGDIGLRAFFQLYKKANEIISREKIDFVYILIPSFYLSLLGSLLHHKHGVKYGIDYIDPWVHFFPGSERIFSRHWFSTKLSKLLEPIAVKRASLITSVSPSYVQPIFDRNKKLINTTKMFSFPYGWDPEEKDFIGNYKSKSQLYVTNNKLKLVYTGVFMPNSVKILKEWLRCINDNIDQFQDVEIHFIGTGAPKSSPNRNSIADIAKEYKLYGTIIFEHPDRIPYFDLLYHISISDGLFILGSTETHYTPSKLFNAFVTAKPVFAILHSASSAKNILDDTNWGIACSFSPNDVTNFQHELIASFKEWKLRATSNKWNFNHDAANIYSARNITSQLVKVINEQLK